MLIFILIQLPKMHGAGGVKKSFDQVGCRDVYREQEKAKRR